MSLPQYIKIPWSGGINDSVDPGMLPDTDLTVADNVILSNNGSRLKREAIDYFDTDIPAVSTRSSSTTTRTLVFATDITGGSDEIFCVGENITVTGSPSNYNVTATPILSVSGATITYAAVASVTEGSTSGTGLTVVRSSPYLCIKDYWRTDGSYNKLQLLVAASSQGKIFKYNSSGQRAEILPTPEVFTIVCGAASTLTQADYFDFNSRTVAYRVHYDIDAAGTAPATGGRTLVEVDVLAGDTDAQLATKTKLVLDALSDVVATVDTATVTVTLDSGATTNAVDGNTGFVFAVTTSGRSISAPFSVAITQICMEVMNEKLIISFDGVGNLPIKYRPETSAYYELLGGTPPDFSIMRQHQSRLFTNDKQNRDRVHYSPPGDPETWNGTGDSAAQDVYPGDGDSVGINSIHPTFKGEIVIGKGEKVYRILGDSPDNYQALLITNGVGVVSNAAVSLIDLDDEFYLSSRGIHSIAATDQYGDFAGAFLSRKIQNTFKTFNSGRLKYAQSTYVPDLNSVFYSIAEDGNSLQNALWIMNTESKEWFRWPDVSCQSLCTRKVNAAQNLVIGTANSRILTIASGVYTDYGSTPYTYRIKTGTLYPGGNPTAWVGFKKIGFLYKPLGNFTFTATVKIDNQEAQSFSFSQSAGGDVLGTTFILGSSRLGSSNVLAPYMQQLDGFGRGCTIEITSSGSSEQVEIYGFIIEFEPADTAQEVLETN